MSCYLSHNYSNSIHVCLTDHEHFSFRFCVVSNRCVDSSVIIAHTSVLLRPKSLSLFPSPQALDFETIPNWFSHIPVGK